MLSWLFVITLAYFFFSLSYLGDKLVLSGNALSAGRQAKAGIFTLYVGLLSLPVVFLIPFANLYFPKSEIMFWIIMDAAAQLLGMYIMFRALRKFEVSRVMTTIGATQPILIFALTWIFFGPQVIATANIMAFLLLLLGSILISFEKKEGIAKGYLAAVLLSSFLFSLDYVFQKFIFLNQTFLQGLVWTRIFIFVFSLLFLFSIKVRKDIFAKRRVINKKTFTIFISSQTAGGLANFLQSFAIFLAPTAFLPIVNSLRGMQYVFLFLMVLFLSAFFPKILKEGLSKKVITQKIISIILIVAGLAILVM